MWKDFEFGLVNDIKAEFFEIPTTVQLKIIEKLVFTLYTKDWEVFL